MTQQPTLFAPLRELEFDRFDAANPEVWRLFVRFAREVIAAGHERFSADALLHRIRWESQVATRGSSPFKINDHFSAFYARKFVRLFPEHAGFFELRERRAVRA